MKTQEKQDTDPYRIDTRWLLAGTSVTTLLAIADVGKTWYWFPHVIPVPLVLYFLAILSVYVSWVGIGIFIGWFRRRVPLASSMRMTGLFIHGGMSVALGSAHLLANTALIGLMFRSTRPMLAFGSVYLEKLVAWLPYEILAYWACLAVFRLVELQGRSHRATAETSKSHQQSFSVKLGDDVRIVSCSTVDWIEALNNYVILHTATEHFTIHESMARLEHSLDPEHFQRIHRSTIVNVNSIDALRSDDSGGLRVVLRCQQSFAVSRRRRSSIRRALAVRRHGAAGS